MIISSARRAAVREEKWEALGADLHKAVESPEGAATPVPIPHEPEPVPIVPLPSVEPNEEETEGDKPIPTTSWAEGVIVAGESLAEFHEFSERLFDHYMPYDCEEQVFVAKLVESRWIARRRKDICARMEAELYALEPNAAQWTDADFRRLILADTYRVQAEETMRQAHQLVDAFMEKRLEDHRFHLNRELAFSRLELMKKKYQFSLWKSGFTPNKVDGREEEESAPATKTAKAS